MVVRKLALICLLSAVFPAVVPAAGAVAAAAEVPPRVATVTPPPGYVLAASDGGVFAFGRRFHGSAAGLGLRAPIEGIASTPDGGGYWLVAADGGVFAFGDARFSGSMAGVTMAHPIVGMAATPDGRGYWLAGSDGSVFAFGDAPFLGRLFEPAPTVGIAPTASGHGYWLLTDTGSVFAFGDARSVQEAPRGFGYAGIARIPGTARGVMIVKVDGTRFTFLGGCPASTPFGANSRFEVVGVVATAGCHAWLVASDGGVFAFGLPFLGSAAPYHPAGRVVGIAS